MSDIHAILKNRGFPKARKVASTASIAHIWRKHRCGIYCLHFADGELYVGQSLDVTKRYLNHRQTWDDITMINFKRVARSKLDQEEESLIKLLERKGFALRNIVYTTPGQVPFGMADFDTLMPAEDQEKWLSDLSYIDESGPRIVNEAQRAKYTRQFQRLLKQPHAEKIIQILREYVRIGIPAYFASEMNFWVCTCQTKKLSPDLILYSRININWQSVFEAYTYKGRPVFSFYVAKSAIEQNSKLKNMLFRFKLVWRGGWSTTSQLKPGGQDQVHFEIDGFEGTHTLLGDPIMQKAIREFNMRLIRQGPTVSSKFHCFDLADRLLD